MAMKFSPKILGLGVRIFRTVFNSPGQCWRFGFDLKTNVFGFCCVFSIWGCFWPKLWKLKMD